MKPAIQPEILLVEDDPTTCAYLQAITERVPAHVDIADSVAAALQRTTSRAYDLWLVDANLPDGSGIDLLSRLRALGFDTPALAHTAARGPEALDPLLRAGFLEVLVKPVDAATWRAAIVRALGARCAEPQPCAQAHAGDGVAPTWDDALAARALGGDGANVAALRSLFLAELPGQVRVIRAHDGDARDAQLHRLRASCALVGAARLDAAVQALQRTPGDANAMQRFRDAAQATLDDLRNQAASSP